MKRRRVYDCCQTELDFSGHYSKGCVATFHEAIEAPSVMELLIPQRYKVIREESQSKLEDLGCEFVEANSVNGMVCLNTFKSPTVQAVEGVLESDHEPSDDETDILYSVYAEAKGEPKVSSKKQTKRITLNRQRSPGRLVVHKKNLGSQDAKQSTADSGGDQAPPKLSLKRKDISPESSNAPESNSTEGPKPVMKIRKNLSPEGAPAAGGLNILRRNASPGRE